MLSALLHGLCSLFGLRGMGRMGQALALLLAVVALDRSWSSAPPHPAGSLRAGSGPLAQGGVGASSLETTGGGQASEISDDSSSEDSELSEWQRKVPTSYAQIDLQDVYDRMRESSSSSVACEGGGEEALWSRVFARAAKELAAADAASPAEGRSGHGHATPASAACSVGVGESESSGMPSGRTHGPHPSRSDNHTHAAAEAVREEEADMSVDEEDVPVDLRLVPPYGLLPRLTKSLWEFAPALRMPLSGSVLAVQEGGFGGVEAGDASKDALFVVGGADEKHVSNGVWMLDDSVEQEWRQVSTMPRASTHHTATWFQHRLWVIGGFNGMQALGDVHAWRGLGRRTGDRGAVGPWQRMPSLPFARSGHAAVSLQGKLYVLGGTSSRDAAAPSSGVAEWTEDGPQYLEDVCVWEPESGCWTSGTPLQTGRYCFAAKVVETWSGARVYVVGGIGEEGVLDSIESWAPGEHQWRFEQPLPGPRYGHSLFFVSGRLYTAGGVRRGFEPSVRCGREDRGAFTGTSVTSRYLSTLAVTSALP